MSQTQYSPPKAPKMGTLPSPQATGVANQPVSAIQWVPRGELTANNWNPNRIVTPEMRLLAISILEDGWTEPIVARPDFVIIDGFHRWEISDWPEIYAMTDGLVPVAFLRDGTSEAQQRMATVRHNRARGTHYVLSMADIVVDLIELGLGDEEIAQRLQMETEEVNRLRDRGQMTKRGSADDFGAAWKPRIS